MINAVQEFWQSQGWLGTAFSVIVPLLAFVVWLARGPLATASHHLFTSDYKTMAAFTLTHAPNEEQILDTLKSSMRIAILDDEPDEFPIDYLQKLGYSITPFTNVSLTQQRELSQYSLIFIDIKGVVEEDRETGGFTLLERLKKSNPRILAIAVSGKSFQPSLNQFFSMADSVLEKPIYPDECERAMTRVILFAFSPHAAAKNIDAILDTHALTPRTHTKALRSIVRYCRTHSDSRKLRKSLTRRFGVPRDCSKEIVHHANQVMHWTGTRQPTLDT